MKYAMIVGDGMADLPIPELNEKTPLEHLAPDAFQAIAGGELGRLRSCPPTLAPGSDTAFLTLLGNDTARVYTGRSPLEAAGMGIELAPGEVAFRMNLAAIGEEGYPDASMLSHNGGGVEGEEAYALVTGLMEDAAFAQLMAAYALRIYPTDTFRHAAVLKWDRVDADFAPPHDIVGRRVGDYAPGGRLGEAICALQRLSYDCLNRHPINEARRSRGCLPANSAWFWGAGTACALPNFERKYGVRGLVISAVPLVKGIARLNGLKAPDYPFATGLLDTGYEQKAQAALDALRGDCDFALVHLEAPDEMSHDGSLERKLEAIRRLNDRIVRPLMAGLQALGDHRVLLLADHYTLLSTRTHDGAPVPYALYDSRNPGAPRPFTEAACAGEPVLESGDPLMRRLFERG